ncbi:MAG: sigma-70 family RNA polymerase sigma factor [Planctomycetaceae bacterium]
MGRPPGFFVALDEVCSVTDDDQLMVRLQEGDAAAFDEIVKRNSGILFGFFLKNTRDPHRAEDLTQEVLLRIYRQFWDYIPVGRFKGWMFRIARNLLIDSIRRRSHDCLVKAVKGRFEDETDILRSIAGQFLTPDQDFDFSELNEVVNDLLDDLPEDQRLTFTLHHFSGLSLPEVAEVLGTSVPTTKSRLRLAREKLSDRLAQRGILNPHRTND